MADRGVRSLAHLENCASTARVLNLRAVWRQYKDDPEYLAQPFFQNSRLNRALILKHRLRGDEMELFHGRRYNATKIIFPVDPTDLKFGGRSIFVGQIRFVEMMTDLIGGGDKFQNMDLPLLTLMDGLPSFDPFLLREELKRNGYMPAALYFRLSENDVRNIFAFVQVEIEPLVVMALGSSGLASQKAKLVDKILSNTLDTEMQPLRHVLKLSEAEFAEGMFCWKGFLYYKWVFQGLSASMSQVINAVVSTKPIGKVGSEIGAEIERIRNVLTDRIVASSTSIRNLLTIYDDSYAKLTKDSDPTNFREFLLKAPLYFSELGERLGVLQHIKSFCDFRFKAQKPALVTAEELVDIGPRPAPRLSSM